MANAWCINAYDCNGCLIQTLQNLDSACIGVGVQYTAPNPLDDKRFDYIKYTDKCWCVQCLSAENEILIYATNGVIKNLTLTNDDVNEAIKIKWNDIFGSNRAKTIVRYKTGSAPVSITDWTLAVEETTKNQYSSTPFSLTGVLDETTYYITAFAVDSNNVVIWTQQTTITTDFWWHPSANTLARYKFEWNINDSSGNSRNLTMRSWSFTYWTLTQWWKYVQTAYNSYTNQINTFPFNSLNWTISFFMSFTNNTPWYWYTISTSNHNWATIFELNWSWWIIRPVLSWWNWSSFNYWTRLLNQDGLSWYQPTVSDSWHYYTYVFNSWTVYRYIDWTYKDSESISVWNSFIFALNVVRDNSSNFSYYSSKYKMGQLIFENAKRSSSDITKYFNKYKAKYWIS